MAPMKASRTIRLFRNWGWGVALYLGIGLLDAGQTVFSMHAVGMHHSWVTLFITLVLSWLPWVIATPAIFSLADRFGFDDFRRGATWCAHIGAVFGIGLIASFWSSALDAGLHPYAPQEEHLPFLTLWSYKFQGGLLGYCVLYAFVLAVRHVLNTRERLAAHKTEAARLNEQLATAQLEALRRQMEPHFLFNSLNAITGLVREHKNDAAVRSIVELSDFLRRIVTQPGLAQASLQTEVELLQLYLRVQQLRFAERLQTSFEIPGELLKAQVPSLMLQPLVENAIKHGISKRARGGLVRVTASRSEDHLTLTVYNDGPALSAVRAPDTTGVGMSNLRARLQILYGSAFALDLCDQPPEGVQALVSVPYRER
jgi:two-component system, LytTR family, sensor kinase